MYMQQEQPLRWCTRSPFLSSCGLHMSVFSTHTQHVLSASWPVRCCHRGFRLCRTLKHKLLWLAHVIFWIFLKHGIIWLEYGCDLKRNWHWNELDKEQNLGIHLGEERKRGSMMEVQSCKCNSGVGFSLEVLVSYEQYWWNCSEPERQHMAENTDYSITERLLRWCRGLISCRK